MRALQFAFVAAFLAGTIFYVVISLHAPMIWDTPIMRYVVFLTAHGMQPYSQITDFNLPGAYLAEHWAMQLFGPFDLGARFYEFFQLALLTASALVIAGRRLWFGGIFASAFFLFLHGSEGPLLATERDECVTVLLLLGYACLFTATRRNLPVLLFPFAAATAFAVSIKPTFALLPLAALALFLVHLRRIGKPWLAPILWTLAGNALIAAIIAAFLLQHHALAPLLFLVRHILPYYTTLRHPGLSTMLLGLTPPTLLLILPFAFAQAFRNRTAFRRACTWEDAALLAGLLIGIFSWFAQGKAFAYHRYLYVAILALLAGKALAAAALETNDRPTRRIAAAGILIALLLVLPGYAFLMPFAQQTGDRVNRLTIALEDDLTRLGPTHLQGQVQCFDLVSGCLNALYHLGLVQNTGFTGDLLFFSREDTPAARFYRNLYWQTIAAHPPSVIVLGNEWFQSPNRTFSKVETWPQFATFLQANYTLATTRTFPDRTPRLPLKTIASISAKTAMSTPATSLTPIPDQTAPAYRIYLLTPTSR